VIVPEYIRTLDSTRVADASSGAQHMTYSCDVSHNWRLKLRCWNSKEPRYATFFVTSATVSNTMFIAVALVELAQEINLHILALSSCCVFPVSGCACTRDHLFSLLAYFNITVTKGKAIHSEGAVPVAR
jgi:hypothetical protein